MSITEAERSELARAAAAARWGNRVVSRAARIVAERAGELTEAQRAQLAAIASPKDEEITR